MSHNHGEKVITSIEESFFVRTDYTHSRPGVLFSLHSYLVKVLVPYCTVQHVQSYHLSSSTQRYYEVVINSFSFISHFISSSVMSYESIPTATAIHTNDENERTVGLFNLNFPFNLNFYTQHLVLNGRAMVVLFCVPIYPSTL